ncbi:hypothetical protein MHH60_20175 [Paenibacillus sp. FSL H7-0716]|uniref:Uncharacterized protein n=1 Tax=Paenibacillus odorifer TaxID=189426 RepID=A0AB36JBG8_9BACL|nr:hypothetical protein [Paenibacillus odorifer]OME16531.1 hypothetical protein BSK47_19910 [Paenibacillus odorifer]
MKRLIADVVPNKFYDFNFETFKNKISPLPLIRNVYGYLVKTNNFMIFLGDNGGLKVGIEYENDNDLLYKFEMALTTLKLINKFYEDNYKENIIKNFLISWPVDGTASMNELNWSFGDFTYKEHQVPSSYGGNYSQLLLI